MREYRVYTARFETRPLETLCPDMTQFEYVMGVILDPEG